MKSKVLKRILSINVLLQITLPMVIILAFVLFSRYNEYQGLQKLKEAIKLEKKELQKLKEAIKRPGWEQYDMAYLELQKQILIKNWEEVKSERRGYFKIDLFFKNDSRIKKVADNFVSQKLIDEDFKDMCGKTRAHLNDKNHQEEEINFLYKDVLQNTLKELKRLEMKKELLFQNIKDENTKFIKKQIEEFIIRDCSEKTLKRLIHKGIQTIF